MLRTASLVSAFIEQEDLTMRQHAKVSKLGMARLAILCGVLAIILASVTNGQTTYYVDDDAPGGNGTSWVLAFRDFQLALGAASPGDEIRVGGGLYKPHASDRSKTFTLIHNVQILGGYAGWPFRFGNPDVRDFVLYETILTGNLNDDLIEWVDDNGDGVLQPGEYQNRADNSYHVVTLPDNPMGVDSGQYHLDGFSIESGQAVDEVVGGRLNGAGLYARPAEMRMNAQEFFFVMKNCTFRYNLAVDGGGLYLYTTGSAFKGALTVEESTFDMNTATNLGGGLFGSIQSLEASWEGIIWIQANCLFSGNYAAGDGGGMYCLVNNSSTPEAPGRIVNCSFIGNFSDGYGGALQDGASDELLVKDCQFTDNIAFSAGGAIHASGGKKLDIENCTFTSNHAFGEGGGGGAVAFFAGNLLDRNTLNITDCAFMYNGAGTRDENEPLPGIAGGGAVHTRAPQTTILRCRFLGNFTVPDPVDCFLPWTGTGGAVSTDLGFEPCCGPLGPLDFYMLNIDDCLFVANSAGFGGGVYSNYQGAITNSEFYGGSAFRQPSVSCQPPISGIFGWGGGVLLHNTRDDAKKEEVQRVENCIFAGNESSNGGAVLFFQMHLLQPATPMELTNSLLVGNTAMLGGGGFFGDYGSAPLITNCTIAKNLSNQGSPTSPGAGGGVHLRGANPDAAHSRIDNCILWENRALFPAAGGRGHQIWLEPGDQYDGGTSASSDLDVSHSDVEGGSDGVQKDTNTTLTWESGNIGGNPEHNPMFTKDPVTADGFWYTPACEGEPPGPIAVFDDVQVTITFTDVNGNFAAGALIGQFLEPKLDSVQQLPTQQFAITANTATTITVWADWEAVRAWLDGEEDLRFECNDEYRIFDYHLNAAPPITSLCVDAGDNGKVPSHITTDLDGLTRFFDVPSAPDCPNGGSCGTAPIVDMGAYELATGDADGAAGVDANCDGILSAADAEVFFRLLSDVALWEAAHANCEGGSARERAAAIKAREMDALFFLAARRGIDREDLEVFESAAWARSDR